MISRVGPMRSAFARKRRRWVALLAGATLGALLGAGGGALAFDVSVDRHNLVWNGLRAEDDTSDGHPFLTTVDGTTREMGAAFFHTCTQWHSPASKYWATHVHHDTNVWYICHNAHLGSDSTGMDHHVGHSG